MVGQYGMKQCILTDLPTFSVHKATKTGVMTKATNGDIMLIQCDKYRLSASQNRLSKVPCKTCHQVYNESI